MLEKPLKKRALSSTTTHKKLFRKITNLLGLRRKGIVKTYKNRRTRTSIPMAVFCRNQAERLEWQRQRRKMQNFGILRKEKRLFLPKFLALSRFCKNQLNLLFTNELQNTKISSLFFGIKFFTKICKIDLT